MIRIASKCDRSPALKYRTRAKSLDDRLVITLELVSRDITGTLNGERRYAVPLL